MYDVVIIGAGVCGAATARELSRYKLKVLVLEKEEDVCTGTSKANSAIIHAGYDAANGSLMARLNVRGNEMMEELAEELDFPFKRIGSLVVSRSEEDMPKLRELYERGIKNGVKGLEIIEGKRLTQMEPELSEDVVDPDDIETLQDLIIAAVNEAIKTVDKLNSEEMNKVTAGLNVPGLM